MRRASTLVPARIIGLQVVAAVCLVLFLLDDRLLVVALLATLAAATGMLAGRWLVGPDGSPWGALGQWRLLSLGTLAVLLVVLPALMRLTPYWLFVLSLAGLHGIMVVGLNLQVGDAGMVNVGFAGFAGVGAYASAVLTTRLGLSPWLGLASGGLMAALVGLLLGLPTARSRGHYFALVTIAFGIVIFLFFYNTSWLGGPDGLGRIPPLSISGVSFREPLSIAGLVLPSPARYYYLILALVALAAWVGVRLHGSLAGLSWEALQEDEIGAGALGIDVATARLWAMAVGTFFAGIGGALYAHLVGFIAPYNFTVLHSIMLLSMVILGGAGNVAGAIVGAFLLTVIPEKLRAFQDYRLLMYGVVIVLMLHFRPQGLFPRAARRYGAVPSIAPETSVLSDVAATSQEPGR